MDKWDTKYLSAAIEAGNMELAFSILGKHLLENPEDSNGWMMMAQLAKEPTQMVDCLDRVAVIRPDIRGLQETLDKIKRGPLKYYNQIIDVVRGYGQWAGNAQSPGIYTVHVQMKNEINDLKESYRTVKKQQHHLEELDKLISGDKSTFASIRLDDKAPTYEAERKLCQSTSPLILSIMISQALKQFEKFLIELEIHIEKKSKEGSATNLPNPRLTIPDDVKLFVWKRDGGKCVKCGSQNNLEYDHIIPVSKGGSNTARNIQLLCEKCNREKGSNLF